MLQKLNTWLKNREEAIKKEQELRKAKRFYSFLKAGASFVKFIQDDLKRTENTMNRHQRRRFEKEIEEKGMFSPELVSYYQNKIDYILMNINQRLNPSKIQNNETQIRTTKPEELK